MSDIRNGKLLYHLTSLANLESILESGLLPRNQITEDRFDDVADQEIITSRHRRSLADFVPFHFFARNPFDGAVQMAQQNQGKDFILITVRREYARSNNWKVIPRHPLAEPHPEMVDYDSGLEAINWETMNRRDYQDADSKSICMAECLSPAAVTCDRFHSIFVKEESVEKEVARLKRARGEDFHITNNLRMFHSA